MRRLFEEVRCGGDVGQMLVISFRDRITSEMDAAIDAEYAAVLDRLPAFLSELD